MSQAFCSIIQSIIDEFSSRFIQFRKFAETSAQFGDFQVADFGRYRMQLLDFQFRFRCNKKFVDLRNDLEIIENDQLLGVIKRMQKK